MFPDVAVGVGFGLPDSVARAQALDHAASMWVEGETHEVVLQRAESFYQFLIKKPACGDLNGVRPGAAGAN